MTYKKLLLPLLAIALIWSCGKDDAPPPPANAAPVIIPVTFTTAENISDTMIIGTVKATDADGDALTFSLTGNEELFEITKSGELSLVNGKNLDFETKNLHSITVIVSDGHNEPVTEPIDIKVIDVLENGELKNDPNSFVTEWNIEKEKEILYISTFEEFEYNYTIDWGDGTIENISTSERPYHIYEDKGIYQVAILGLFPAIRMAGSPLSSKYALIDVLQWGTGQWLSMELAFTECINLSGFSATDIPNLSNVNSMNNMFAYAIKFNDDISHWDFSKVTKMVAMFNHAEVFNQDLGNWDISNVEFANLMLNHSGLSAENFSLTLQGWSSLSAQATNENSSFPADIILFEGLEYCDDLDTQNAIDNLAQNHGWDITENPVQCN